MAPGEIALGVRPGAERDVIQAISVVITWTVGALADEAAGTAEFREDGQAGAGAIAVLDRANRAWGQADQAGIGMAGADLIAAEQHIAIA